MSIIALLFALATPGTAIDLDCLDRPTPEEAQACANDAYEASVGSLRGGYEAMLAYVAERDAAQLPRNFVSENTGKSEFDRAHTAWINYRNEACYFEARLIDRAFYIPAAVQLCRARMNLERGKQLRNYLQKATERSAS